jgi:type IV pilus assembly protein PilE
MASQAKRLSRGFTLIELMIVVAIVAVLATVAYPGYINGLVKANRAAAQSYLMDIAQRQRQYFNDTRTFASSESILSMTRPERVTNNYNVVFTLVADPNSPPEFTITATPLPGSRQVGDGALSIDETGEKLRGSESW